MKRESNVEFSTQETSERANQDIPKNGGNSEMIKKISEKVTGVKDYAMLLQHELKFLQIENRHLRNKNQQLQEDKQCLEAENQLLKDDSWCLQKENQQLQMQVNTCEWGWEFGSEFVVGFFFIMTAVIILACVLMLGAISGCRS